MRQQLIDVPRSLRREPPEYILEISIWVVPIDTRRFDQARDCPRPLAAAQRPS